MLLYCSISPPGIAASPRSDAPANKWTTPLGYVPASVGGPLISAIGSALSSAPAKKWQAYGGYEPKRGATPPTPLASADARGDRPPAPLALEVLTDLPPTSADARGDRPPTPLASAASTAAAPASTFFKSESKTEMKSTRSTGTRAAAEQSSSAPMTSAAARKWEPYGGYDPRSRRAAAAPSPAAASSGSSAVKSESNARVQTQPQRSPVSGAGMPE